ncbi:class F sortase [Modestobacter sp. SYSU DS0511]
MRITGAYPPPLVDHQPTEAPYPTADRPRVTRYDRSRHRAPRPTAPRVWAGTSAALAVAGLSAVLFLPQGAPSSARLDAPVAVAATAGAGVPSAPPPSATPDAVLQLPASAPVHIQIPALGVTSDVMELGLERDGSLEVPPGAYPVGWYEGSPTPGQRGPAVVAGHVDWHGEPGAFYGLRELLPGDEVVIERADGTMATFRVDRVEEHGKDAFPTDAVYGDIDHAGLRLITCGGAFDDESGGYLDNVIVFADLVSSD